MGSDGKAVPVYTQTSFRSPRHFEIAALAALQLAVVMEATPNSVRIPYPVGQAERDPARVTLA